MGNVEFVLLAFQVALPSAAQPVHHHNQGRQPDRKVPFHPLRLQLFHRRVDMFPLMPNDGFGFCSPTSASNQVGSVSCSSHRRPHVKKRAQSVKARVAGSQLSNHRSTVLEAFAGDDDNDE